MIVYSQNFLTGSFKEVRLCFQEAPSKRPEQQVTVPTESKEVEDGNILGVEEVEAAISRSKRGDLDLSGDYDSITPEAAAVIGKLGKVYLELGVRSLSVEAARELSGLEGNIKFKNIRSLQDPELIDVLCTFKVRILSFPSVRVLREWNLISKFKKFDGLVIMALTLHGIDDETYRRASELKGKIDAPAFEYGDYKYINDPFAGVTKFGPGELEEDYNHSHWMLPRLFRKGGDVADWAVESAENHYIEWVMRDFDQWLLEFDSDKDKRKLASEIVFMCRTWKITPTAFFMHDIYPKPGSKVEFKDSSDPEQFVRNQELLEEIEAHIRDDFEVMYQGKKPSWMRK